MHGPKIPNGAEIVRTYAKYGQLVEAFFQGHYQLLIAVGRPGLAKSYEFEERLGRTSHLIKGWTAPLQAYIEAYRHRNQLLIFDDAEVLWKRPGGRVLIRSLCEHRLRKLVQWTSTTKDLVKADVPQRFTTSSKVAIIANRFVFGSEDEQEAVLDRGHLIYFEPPPLEVHNRVGDWFWDQEIYDYIGDRLHLLDENSSRVYIKIWERKNAGDNWKQLIEERYCHDKVKALVQALETDPNCKTVTQRVERFIKETGCCRATYFNLKRELKSHDQLRHLEKIAVPQRKLRGKPPNVDEYIEDPAEIDSETRENSLGGQLEAKRHGLPSWYDYSDNPDDYADYSDFVADWWKRPQPVQQVNEESDSGVDCCAWLRRALQEAVDREDYQRAAELRDEIRRIEERRTQDDN